MISRMALDLSQFAAGLACPAQVAFQGGFATFDQIITGSAVAAALVLLFLAVSKRNVFGWDPATLRSHAFEPVDLFFVATAYFFAASFVLLVFRALESEDLATLQAILSGNAAQLAGGAACLLLASLRFRGGVREFLIGRTVPAGIQMRDTVLILLLAVGLCPLVLAGTVEVITRVAPSAALPTHSTLSALDETTSPAVQWGLWLGAALVAPVCEELFFRGLLQTFLVKELGSRTRAVLIAAMLFALVHLSVVQTLPALFLMGILLGVLYERTGSLVAVILVHSLFNIKTLVWHHFQSVVS